ncbi:MAG: CoA pyrophosphatase, partial [Acidobacteria bacterium]|nr:CoA pyrophosphatase [Acidobacteriota bacterium]
SGFTLQPVVGLCEQTPPLRPTTDEVERIIEVTIDDLLDASRLRTRETLRDGSPFLVPYFDLGGGEVWGATAMVLAEFRALIGFPVL